MGKGSQTGHDGSPELRLVGGVAGCRGWVQPWLATLSHSPPHSATVGVILMDENPKDEAGDQVADEADDPLGAEETVYIADLISRARDCDPWISQPAMSELIPWMSRLTESEKDSLWKATDDDGYQGEPL